MGQSITVTRGFGWVLDHFDGDWAGNLEQFLSSEQQDDLYDSVTTTMKTEGLEVVLDWFGYDRAAVALLAKASVVDRYDYEHDLAEVYPGPAVAMAEPQYRRELAQALDALEWDEAELGEPKWLLLVTYG